MKNPASIHIRKTRDILFIATLICADTFNCHGAEAPRLLPFQGRLTDQNGTAVSNGVRLVQFKIFEVPSGASPMWAGELHRTTVNGGLVNVLLGSKTPFTGVDFDRQIYLEITVDINGDNAITAADPPMLPRQAILPVVFAKESADSRKLAGYDWSGLLNTNDPVHGRLDGSKIADNSIAWRHLAPRPIGTNVGLGGVAMGNPVYNRFTTSSTALVEVPNIRVTLVSQGRPVMVLLCVADLSQIGNVSFTRDTTTSPPVIHAVGYLEILRGTNIIASSETVLRAAHSTVDDVLSLSLPPSAFSAIDVAPTGTNTYSIRVRVYDVGHSVDVQNVRLVAYEL